MARKQSSTKKSKENENFGFKTMIAPDLDMYGLFDDDGNIRFCSFFIEAVRKEQKRLKWGKIFIFKFRKIGDELK